MPAQRKRDILRLVIKSIIVLSPYRVRLNYFYGGEIEAGSYVFQRFGEGGIRTLDTAINRITV